MRLRARLARLYADLARVPVPSVTPDLHRLVALLVEIGVPEGVARESVVRPDGSPDPETLAYLVARCNEALERRRRQPAPEQSRQPAAEEPSCRYEPSSPA